jgi:teichuronic acid biosynthesis glycosyltransferase TuaC
VTRPLRILTLSTLFPDASRPNFGIFVERSVTAMAEQPDTDVTVIAPVGVPPWPLAALARYAPLSRLPQREQWHGLSVLRPRWRLWPGAGAAGNGAKVAAAALTAVRDLRPFDIIDAHFFHPDAVAAQHLSAALAIPYCVTARGTDIALWAGRAETGPGILAAAKGAAGMLAVSAAIREQMIARGFPAESIEVQHTGVDANRFKPLDRMAARQSLGLGDGLVLLTVGTLNQNKGQHLVIAALPDIAGATYLIAGTGPDAESLAALAKTHQVADRVRFLGSVPHAKVPSLYNAADIVVQPSANEGLANAWVEAMACGTPVIAADIPPAHEAVDAPHGGRIVERTSAAITGAVQDLLMAPPDRAALSQRTHARFNWDRHGATRAAYLRALV